MTDQTRRDYYEKRKGALDTERSSFISHYKEISDNIDPRRGRFETTDRNKGTKKHRAIINSRATQDLEIATSGLFAGVMSPTRPWLELAVPDPQLTKFPPVSLWLKQVTAEMLQVFNASNLYVMAPPMLRDLLLFSTGCMSHVDDTDTLARFFTHTAGSYLIGQNDKFEVTTLVREFEMTAIQMATEFGTENLSVEVKRALEQHDLEGWYKVTQFIEPNDEFRFGNPMTKFKKFSSVKYEAGNTDKDMFLSESGFDEFPAYVPRWSVTGEDIYGTNCPGMTTLGDVKQLQLEEKRKAQAIDKMTNPPMSGPASLRNVPVSSLPGGLTIYDADPTQNRLEPLYTTNFPIDQISNDMRQVERRISEGWFVDLFKAITNMEGIQPRNQLELSERRAESLLQLGPVLERVHGDFLGRLVSRTFNQMVRAGRVPPAPQEIIDQPLRVNYISSLALAQRAVDTRPIQALAQFTAELVSSNLSDGKKFNGDAAIDKFAELTGVSPEVIVPDEVIAQQRQAEAQAAAQQRQIEQAQMIAQSAAAAGQVDLDTNNPVSAITEG